MIVSPARPSPAVRRGSPRSRESRAGRSLPFPFRFRHTSTLRSVTHSPSALRPCIWGLKRLDNQRACGCCRRILVPAHSHRDGRGSTVGISLQRSRCSSLPHLCRHTANGQLRLDDEAADHALHAKSQPPPPRCQRDSQILTRTSRGRTCLPCRGGRKR